jgi:hypothetical protein
MTCDFLKNSVKSFCFFIGAVLATPFVLMAVLCYPCYGEADTDTGEGKNSSSFWTNENDVKDPKCSVCLCEFVLPEDEKNIGVSACCHERMHKECASKFWVSVGDLKCPHCHGREMTAVTTDSSV